MLSKREGLALYWGEGFKTRKGAYKVGVTNTDPKLVQAYVEWLENHYGVSRIQLKARLFLHNGLDIEAATTFWEKTLRIPRRNFLKPFRKEPGTKGYRKSKYEYGLCSVTLNSKKTLLSILSDISNL